MNLIELIFAIVLVIIIVKPPTSFRKIVITNSGRLIFAFVVLYLALNHGKVVSILGCLIFIVTLNNDILEGMKPKKDVLKKNKNSKKNKNDTQSKIHKNATMDNFSKKASDGDEPWDYKNDMNIPKDYGDDDGGDDEDSVLNNYINRSWSKDDESKYGDLESGDWDNTECKRYLDKCSYDSLRVIRENAPVISRKYSYKKAKSILDRLIKESLHNCLRYAKKKMHK